MSEVKTIFILELALTVCGFIPMYEISNLASAGTFKEKFPSMSVTVPVLEPIILTDAPTTGSPSSEEVTLPVTEV